MMPRKGPGDVARGAAALASLTCAGWLFSTSTYADSPTAPTQLSIAVIADGKTTGHAVIVFPHGSEMKMYAGKIIPATDNEDIVRLVGDASVSAKLNGVDLGSVYGDELLVSKEILDANRVAAKRELEAVLASDQSTRSTIAERSLKENLASDAPEFAAQWKEQQAIDRRNQETLDRIVKQYGWPTFGWAGRDGTLGAFLVVQHADLAYQRRYLPMIEEAVRQCNLSPGVLALLEDRIRVREGKKQIYGTQLHSTQPGKQVPEPIEDEANVDARRAKVGLEPLAEYLKRFDPEETPQSH